MAETPPVGRTILVDNRPYRVLGVARKDFTGVEAGRLVDVWLPVTVMDPGVFANEARLFHVLGRMKPGVTTQQLAAQLQPAFRREQELRIARGGVPAVVQQQMRSASLILQSGANGIAGLQRSFSRPLWILLGVSACILLIASANVASLLLARSSARGAEVAVRVSLGAGGLRLLRQLLTESLPLSTMAGICGWLLANAAAPALLALVSTKAEPIQLALRLNTQVLLFCAAVCAASALLFGLLPALQATSAGTMGALKQAAGQAGRLRLGRVFVGVQVAFAFCLVMGGAGFLYSLRNLASVNRGFDAARVTVLTVNNTPRRDRQFPAMQQLQSRTAAMPGVEGATGRQVPEDEETLYRVSPGYFATLRTPLIAGRDFTARDNDDEPVATVVNRAFARKYLGSDDALGREFRRDDGVRRVVVGVAGDSRFGSLRNGAEPIAYMPMKPPRTFTMYVRSEMDAASVAQLVDRQAQAVGTGIRVRDVTTLEALVGSTIRTEKLLAGIGGAFAFLGLVLAATGLSGLLNYSVARREREIGIRGALGAGRTSIYRLVLGDLAGRVGLGLAAGGAGAVAVMRLTSSLLFGVREADAAVMATAVAVFAAAALAAGWLPARRAAAIDPAIALRGE